MACLEVKWEMVSAEVLLSQLKLSHSLGQLYINNQFDREPFIWEQKARLLLHEIPVQGKLKWMLKGRNKNSPWIKCQFNCCCICCMECDTYACLCRNCFGTTAACASGSHNADNLASEIRFEAERTIHPSYVHCYWRSQLELTFRNGLNGMSIPQRSLVQPMSVEILCDVRFGSGFSFCWATEIKQICYMYITMYTVYKTVVKWQEGWH